MSARPRAAAFQPFTWHHEEFRDDALLDFSARIKDLGCGLQKCLEMVEIAELEREHCANQDPPAPGVEPDVPLLSVFDAGTLTRFAVVVATVIGEEAERFHSDHIDFLQAKAKREAVASKGANHA